MIVAFWIHASCALNAIPLSLGNCTIESKLSASKCISPNKAMSRDVLPSPEYHSCREFNVSHKERMYDVPEPVGPTTMFTLPLSNKSSPFIRSLNLRCEDVLEPVVPRFWAALQVNDAFLKPMTSGEPVVGCTVASSCCSFRVRRSSRLFWRDNRSINMTSQCDAINVCPRTRAYLVQERIHPIDRHLPSKDARIFIRHCRSKSSVCVSLTDVSESPGEVGRYEHVRRSVAMSSKTATELNTFEADKSSFITRV